MIKSMTGFGLGTFSNQDLEVRIETKTLNSKFADITVRFPKLLSEKELEIRNIINTKLTRGKINVSIDVQLIGKAEPAQQYNEDLFVQYYRQLKRLADKVIASDMDLFKMAIQSPDVVMSKTENALDPEIWGKVQEVLEVSLNNCDDFRKDEGKSIEKQLVSSLDEIENALKAVEEIDPHRIVRIKERISNNLKEVIEEEQLDKNRLEQEIIFYIEKLDIAEEKTRLRNHIEYFKETLDLSESNGKKLNFISQEMGREINTLGSKANDSSIQKKVVVMKDELEKIKEQILNAL